MSLKLVTDKSRCILFGSPCINAYYSTTGHVAKKSRKHSCLARHNSYLTKLHRQCTTIGRCKKANLWISIYRVFHKNMDISISVWWRQTWLILKRTSPEKIILKSSILVEYFHGSLNCAILRYWIIPPELWKLNKTALSWEAITAVNTVESAGLCVTLTFQDLGLRCVVRGSTGFPLVLHG